MTGNDTNTKGTTMRRPTHAQLVAIGKIDAECKRLGSKCCKRPDGISDRTWWSLYRHRLIETTDRDGDTPLVTVGSFGRVWLHTVPKQQTTEATIRVPAKFFDDHEERECEPFCTPVKRTSRFVWLRPDDEGLTELLDDAKHYSDDDGGPFGYEGCAAMRRSAAATVDAIEQAMVAK
jgi:hypothetical protein